jgi:hypothetical protein
MRFVGAVCVVFSLNALDKQVLNINKMLLGSSKENITNNMKNTRQRHGAY